MLAQHALDFLVAMLRALSVSDRSIALFLFARGNLPTEVFAHDLIELDEKSIALLIDTALDLEYPLLVVMSWFAADKQHDIHRWFQFGDADVPVIVDVGTCRPLPVPRRVVDAVKVKLNLR